MNWFLVVVKKYAEFSGRARRAEYWYFILFYTLIYLGLSLIDGMTGSFSASSGMGLLSGLFALGLLVPSIAVGVRRLHDTDRCGWWLLLGLVPIIGGIILLVLLAMDGTPGDNQYGPNPKAAAPDEAAAL